LHRSERVVVGHRFYRGFKHDAHPMAIMVGVAGALSAFYAKAADIACAFMPVIQLYGIPRHCWTCLWRLQAALGVESC